MVGFLDDVIDCSDAQGPPNPPIDWAAVYAYGVRVAFIKAMEAAGLGYPTWASQSAGARAAGIFVIPYLFLRPSDPDLVVAHFLQETKLARMMPYMLDWEGRAADTADPGVVDAIGQGLCAVAERLPTGYWGIAGSTPRPPTTYMRTWPRSVPRYPRPGITKFSELPQSIQSHPEAFVPDALFWQYTESGVVPGITGPVDRSVWLGTEVERDSWLRSGVMPARFPGSPTVPPAAA